MTTKGKAVRLIATARQMRDGRTLHSGAEFYADEGEAADLIALQFARRAPEQPPEERRQYRRRDMRADE